MDISPQPSPQRVADLSREMRRWLELQRYDSIIEKHEGPWSWDFLLSPRSYQSYDPETGGYREVHPAPAEFLQIAGRTVLLPVTQDRHPNLRARRVIVGESGESLTLFLTDTTFDDGLGSGRVAVCDRAPGGDWYLCHVWHEWYPTDWPPLA